MREDCDNMMVVICKIVVGGSMIEYDRRREEKNNDLVVCCLLRAFPLISSTSWRTYDSTLWFSVKRF